MVAYSERASWSAPGSPDSSCARARRPRRAATVLVLDRARGVGGRCATHRLLGMPFDHRGLLPPRPGSGFPRRRPRACPGAELEGWPRAIRGTGRPCQPEAFQAGEERIAVRRRGDRLSQAPGSGLAVRTGAGSSGSTSPGTAARGASSRGARKFGRGTSSSRSPRSRSSGSSTASPDLPRPLAAVAGAPRDLRQRAVALPLRRLPGGDARPCLGRLVPGGLPRRSSIVAHESGKREAPPFLGLVLQAQPVLGAAAPRGPGLARRRCSPRPARVLGTWAGEPVGHPRPPLEVRPHRPRLRAVGPGPGPAAVRRRRLGICGDRFAPGGGVEAAWISGRVLGRRLAALEVA